MCVWGGGGGGGRQRGGRKGVEGSRVCYFCEIDINGLIWGHVLRFASAIFLEILLLLTLTHNLLMTYARHECGYIVILSAF